MKNISTKFIILITILLPLKMFAAEEIGMPVKTWSLPATYALDEKVEWYFDMKGTGFVDGEDIFLWAWSPSEPDAGNIDHSSDFAKLEYVGDMVWKMVLTPTDYFSMSASDIANSAGFWMRLKRRDASVESGVINLPFTFHAIDDFKDKGIPAEIYPEKFYLDEPLSILINSKYLWVGGEQGIVTAGEELHIHSGLNNFAEGVIVGYDAANAESSEKTTLDYLGGGIYRFNMTPRQYYGANEDFVMQNIEFLIPSKNWEKVGTDKSGNFVFYAPEAIIPPDPELLFFPQKLSQYDLLIAIRKNNEAHVNTLNYKITAGKKTFTGSFEGPKLEMKAYINLFKELAGQPPLEKLTIEITDQLGNEIRKTDIPLVPVSELE